MASTRPSPKKQQKKQRLCLQALMTLASKVSMQQFVKQKLSQMLKQMKIQIPDSMLKQLNKCLEMVPPPKFSFFAFTQYVARASLEQELQEQMRNLFYHLDVNKQGRVDAQDLMQFIRQLQFGDKMNEQQINNFMNEMDLQQVGYLTYEDFVYLLLPK